MPTTTPFANLITFSRGTNATVVGPDGLVQWAPSNLLTYSESFDSTAWFKGNTTVTANAAVAPDGSTTADQIAFAAVANANIQPNPAVTVTAGQVYTFSIYVRASAPVSNVRLSMQGSDTTISVGTAWSRVSMTVTASGGTLAPTLVTRDSVAATIFLWGAQLELGSAATTYNPTTVKNLLGFSEAFDNAAWTKNAASIVTGAAANPVNGLFNAQKLMEDTANAQHIVSFPSAALPANVPVTLSVYAKAAGRQWIRLQPASGNQAWFDVVNGVVGTVQAGVTASITAVGNGWYRCSATTNYVNQTNYIFLANANNATSYTGDGNSGIYIYGAQLSDSASLDPYVPTPGAAPSSTAYYGPRFDYDPVTRAPRGILIEEQRTNLFTYSEQFDNAAWAKTNGGVASAPVVTANFGTSPDGATNADRVQFALNGGSTASDLSDIVQAVTVSAGSVTISVWLRSNTGSNQTIVALGEGAQRATWTVTTTWQRFTVTYTSTGGAGNFGLRLRGTVTPDTADILVWGAQLEAGSFATSYIPTIASTVTRSADVATITGQNFGQWHRQDEGTFIIRYQAQNVSSDVYMTSDGTPLVNSLGMYTSTTSEIGWCRVGGVTQTSMSVSVTPSILHTTANAYARDNFGISAGGGAVTTDTSGSVPTVNQLRFGASAIAGGGQGLWITSFRYIPVRAADFQLQALTT